MSDDAHAAHHGPSLGQILGIFGALIALTLVTVAVAYQDLGQFSALAALGIAGVKGTLVILYFMHVRYSSRLIALYAVSGFLFLAILIGVTMSEVSGRPAQPDVDPLAPKPVPAAAPRGVEEPP